MRANLESRDKSAESVRDHKGDKLGQTDNITKLVEEDTYDSCTTK